MPSRAEQKIRVRRSAEDRRAEIVAAATQQALSGGLDLVTLRSVADELGVVSSLVSHYFPSVDTLLAEAFAGAAGGELDEIFADVDRAASPLEGFRRLLTATVAAEERDQISMLWIDAWHVARRRPALYDEVSHQMSRWLDLSTGLVEAGCRAGQFTSSEPRVSAGRIIAVIDGLSVQSVMRGAIDYASVRELVFLVAERELGLETGTLSPDGQTRS